MNALNDAFKNLAEKMHLPAFFKGTTLLFNNLFLALLTLVFLIALLLVIFLVPSKKKKAIKGAEAKIADKADEPAEEQAPAEEVAETKEEAAEEQVVKEEPAAEEAPVEEAPVVEEAPAEETPAEETKEEAVAAESVKEEVAEEPAAEATAEPAQEPAKEEVLAENVAEDKPAESKGKSGGKYEIVKKNGSFFFLLKANNGQLLLCSSGYTTEQGAKKAIDTFKNAVEVGEFHIDEDKNGNFKFILKASARSQVLYIGESYGTRQSAENAVQSVKNFAFRAVIKRVEEADEEDTALVEFTALPESEQKLGGKYEIEERNGYFYFLLKANNGQLLLESPAFTTEQGAKGGIDSFKKAAETGVYSIDEDKNGNFRFTMRASVRSQVRYFGESYSTRQSAENSVTSVRSFAQKAILK